MVAHLHSATVRKIVGAVVQEGLDHPSLVASLHRGVQVRLVGEKDIASILKDLSALNTTGRLDDGSLPMQVYLETALFMLHQTGRAKGEGGDALRAAIDELMAVVTTQQGGPEFRWAAPATRLEQLTAGASSLLDIAWLELGMTRSRAVARVRAGGIGTAFLVAPTLMLTNHHVAFQLGVPAIQDAAVDIWFNYQSPPPGGVEPEVLQLKGVVRPVEANLMDDWALIRLERAVELPVVRLRPPTRPLEVDDRVCIVQHPDGGPKKLSVHKNLVRSVDASGGRVQYLTDTLGGSSGSPVFDERWELVAIHHAAISARVAGDRVENRNEGIAVDAVLRGIQRQCGPEIITAL